VLSDVAKETVAYKLADYQYTSGASETFYQYMTEMRAAGGSMHTHPFFSKIPIWHRNPEAAAQAAVRQLNAGQVGIMMQEVESPTEIRDAIKAMRFASAGGTRPDSGIDAAAAYWGLTPQQYKQKADVWPLNKNGELLVWAIVESREGLAHVREIASASGVGVVWAGYGTLGGVFSGDPAGREAAALQILAACKEYKVPCGFPVNNPAEMERRMAEGWSVFVMQSRNDAGFAAIETGRKLGKRGG
jgi:4-hydroxy-2-oxoheptanedioate aldolase